MIIFKNTLLAAVLICSMTALGAENHVHNTDSTPSMITSPMGVRIRLKKLPINNNKINAQVPVIKRLSTADTTKIKKNFSKENRVIEHAISDFYRKNQGDIIALETTVELISDNSQYTSIAINKNISNATERYFIWNILIDKSTGLMISPNQAFQHFGFSFADVQSQINDWIKPCMNPNRKIIPDRCMDMGLDSFVQQIAYEDISSIKPSGVYLKNRNLGVSFDTNKFSPSFEFDLKTKKIINVQ